MKINYPVIWFEDNVNNDAIMAMPDIPGAVFYGNIVMEAMEKVIGYAEEYAAKKLAADETLPEPSLPSLYESEMYNVRVIEIDPENYMKQNGFEYVDVEVCYSEEIAKYAKENALDLEDVLKKALYDKYHNVFFRQEEPVHKMDDVEAESYKNEILTQIEKESSEQEQVKNKITQGLITFGPEWAMPLIKRMGQK